MAGTLVQVISPRIIAFDTVAFLGSATVLLKRGIDVSSWQSAALLVRITTNNIVEPSNFIKFFVYSEGPTSDDPAATFVDPVPKAVVQVDGNDVEPLLKVAELTSFGPMVRVTAQGTRNNANGTINVMASVDLCLKNWSDIS